MFTKARKIWRYLSDKQHWHGLIDEYMFKKIQFLYYNAMKKKSLKMPNG